MSFSEQFRIDELVQQLPTPKQKHLALALNEACQEIERGKGDIERSVTTVRHVIAELLSDSDTGWEDDLIFNLLIGMQWYDFRHAPEVDGELNRAIQTLVPEKSPAEEGTEWIVGDGPLDLVEGWDDEKYIDDDEEEEEYDEEGDGEAVLLEAWCDEEDDDDEKDTPGEIAMDARTKASLFGQAFEHVEHRLMQDSDIADDQEDEFRRLWRQLNGE